MITENDVRLFDVITQAIQNFALIVDLDKELADNELSKKTSLGQEYYLKWCEKRVKGRAPRPLNPGTIWMMTSAIIINSKKWEKYLPTTAISQSPDEWGLKKAEYTYPKDPDPSIQTVVTKMRNALAHSRIEIIIGDLNLPGTQLLAETFFVFKDRDGFEMKVSILDLSRFNSAIYEEIVPVMKRFMETYHKK